jgi:hypothetical protein
VARHEDGLAAVELGLHAREARRLREAAEIALVLLHPGAEPLPEDAGFGFGERSSVDEDA